MQSHQPPFNCKEKVKGKEKVDALLIASQVTGKNQEKPMKMLTLIPSKIKVAP